MGPFDLQLKRTPSIFVALAEAIVYQQLTGKAAATIYARLCSLFPRAHDGPAPEQILRATDEKLRSAGLSASKRQLSTKKVQSVVVKTVTPEMKEEETRGA